MLRPLVGTRFQVLFTPLTGVLFTFRSRYYCTIGRQVVLSLGRWASQIHTGFHVSGATWETVKEGLFLSDTGLSPSMAELSRTVFLETTFVTSPPVRIPTKTVPSTPETQRTRAYTHRVWAGPLSLAATQGVEVSFHSRGY